MGIKRSRTDGIVVHRAEVFSTLDYHYIVMRDGGIRRNVPQDEKGAHAKDYNGVTLGVAVFGDFASLEPGQNRMATDQQIDSTVYLCRTLNAMYGGKLWIAGHSQLGTKGTDVPQKLVIGHTCPGENFPLSDVIARSTCTPWLAINVV